MIIAKHFAKQNIAHILHYSTISVCCYKYYFLNIINSLRCENLLKRSFRIILLLQITMLRGAEKSQVFFRHILRTKAPVLNDVIMIISLFFILG